jgi:DNA-binding MarR family transcriptional regulator
METRGARAHARPGTGGASAPSAMHTIFFGLKRAHHSTLRLTRADLARLGLTAARFDLLYAVRQYRRGVAQSSLRKMLGVCRATVSKMLGSLEKLGLVKRSLFPLDRRRKLVELTNRGKWRIGRAHCELTLSGWAQLAVDSALGAEGCGYHWYDPDDCIEATSLLDGLLRHVREAFGDRATLEYPWSPDDAGTLDLDEELHELERDRLMTAGPVDLDPADASGSPS